MTAIAETDELSGGDVDAAEQSLRVAGGQLERATALQFRPGAEDDADDQRQHRQAESAHRETDSPSTAAGYRSKGWALTA